jgi:hypothetical protein
MSRVQIYQNHHDKLGRQLDVLLHLAPTPGGQSEATAGSQSETTHGSQPEAAVDALMLHFHALVTLS